MRTAEDVVEEMHSLCQRLAYPSQPGEKLKTIYARLSKAGGVSWREAKKYWQRERKLIPGHVLDNFRDAVEAHERQTDQRIADARKQYARFYPLTDQSHDQEFYRARAGEYCPPTDDVG